MSSPYVSSSLVSVNNEMRPNSPVSKSVYGTGRNWDWYYICSATKRSQICGIRGVVKVHDRVNYCQHDEPQIALVAISVL